MWDVGGSEKLRPLWHHYFANTDVVIYVIALDNTDQWEASVNALASLLRESELESVPILVLGNKADAADVKNTDELRKLVEKQFASLASGGRPPRLWHFQAVSVKNGIAS